MINTPNNFKTYVKNKRDLNIIHVIRKRDIKDPQKSWWNHEKGQDKYYSGFLQEKHYLYSFTEQHSAEKCLEFLKYYNLKNNKYPDLLGNDERIFNIYKSVIHEDSYDDIYIDKFTVQSLKMRCMLNNIGLLAINEFDYIFADFFLGQRNVFNLSMSAVDLLEDEKYNRGKQVEHYNYLLDI